MKPKHNKPDSLNKFMIGWNYPCSYSKEKRGKLGVVDEHMQNKNVFSYINLLEGEW